MMKDIFTFLKLSHFSLIILMIIAASDFSHSHRFHYVKWDAAGNNNGSNWANAFNNLQDALNIALAKDTIFVAAGVYYPDRGFGLTQGDRNASFKLKGGVVIIGGYVGNEVFQSFESANPGDIWNKYWRNWQKNKTILSGDLMNNDNSNISPDELTRSDNSIHIITTLGPLDSTAELNGFIIEGGNANSTQNFAGGRGGAIYISNSTFQIKNCVFQNNTSLESGGAIFSNGGELRIKFVSFINNRSKTGGGISFAGADNLSDPKMPRIINSYFYNNKADNRGAGIYAYNAVNPNIINSVFTENAALNSGSIGGAFYGDSKSYPEIVNSTFYKNNAGSAGGGVTLCAGRVSNSIFKSNTASSEAQIFIEGQPANPSASRTFITSAIEGGFTGIQIYDIDPMFVQPDNPMGSDGLFGTPDDGLKLQNMSPVIDSGTSWLNTHQSDILGYPRFSNDVVDYGAYEHQKIPVDYKQLYDELKKGGYILLFRHAITDHSQQDQEGYQNDLANCDLQRNLNAEGKVQSIDIWNTIRLLEIPFDTALASPMCRTKFTARYIFGPYKQTVVWMGIDPQHTSLKRASLGKITAAGLNFPIITHQNSIEEVTSYKKGEVQEGDAVVIKPLGGTNFQEIAHITTDTWEKMIVYVSNVTGVDDDEMSPEGFALFDNYPNPFNPVTNIEYVIPSDEFVSLTIYDMLGKKVISLFDEFKRAGNHKVQFDASRLASGVYFYTLKAGKFLQTKKLMLMK